jgi:hypothetical protein
MKLRGALAVASRHAPSPKAKRGKAEQEVMLEEDSHEDSLVHAKHTVHVTRVITKEDTPKGGEHTQQVGLERDRGLNPLWVGGSSEDSATGH